jgi:hypothetical protein
VNRRLGPKRTPGGADGLTRAQAEKAMRRLMATEATRPQSDAVAEMITVDRAADALRDRVAVQGARLSYRQNPDLQFLTPRDHDAVIAVIPDAVVDRDSLARFCAC